MLLTRFRLLLCLAFIASPAVLADTNVDLDGALPTDPSIEYRSLPNGMRYWVRPDTRPAGRISLWLRVGSGSINEEDDQRGLAHLLEHLAFNGSANFPAGTLVQRFEAAGLTFGAHQNATTSFVDTIYKLTIPNDPELLDLSLLYFADVAHRLTLDSEEVVRASRVVLAERRARDNAAARAFTRQLSALVPGSRFAERMPIGDAQAVREATAEQLRAYYRKRYRPDNTVLLVAGDVDAAALEALVRKHFGDWQAASDPAPDHSPGIRPYESERAEIVNEYGLVSADVNVSYLEPPRDFTSVHGYRAWLVHGLGQELLNWRLRELILEGQAPFGSAWAAFNSSFGKTLVEARAKGAPHAWEAVLKGLLTELKRAREHGFSDAEFRHAAQVTLAECEKNALEEPDASALHWLGIMDAALDENRRPLGAGQAHDLCRRLLPTITRAEVEGAVRARYAPTRRTLTLALPKRNDLEAPAPAQVLAIARAVEAAPVAKRTERTWPTQLLAQEPAPGRTAEHALHGDLNVLSATLENGVRLHIRPMIYKKDHVSVRITLAGGRINETPMNVGVTEIAALPFEVPAADTLSSTDIHRLMKTRQVTVAGRDTAGALKLDIEGRRRDLEDGFRLAHLLLTRARIEPARFEQWRRQALARQANRAGSVVGQLNDRVNALLTSNDPRFRELSPEDVKRLTLADGQAWLDGILATAPIEVAIVGDISHEEALALALKYVGSLPPRAPVAGAHSAVRALRVSPGPYAELVKVDTATPKAMVYLGWRGPDWRDVHDWQVLDLAGRVLSTRLLNEVRERRGLVYSIRARSTTHTLYQGNGRFRVSFAVDPAEAEAAAAAAQQVIDEFVRTGPTPEELATAREQASLSFSSGSLDPAFWLEILSDLDYMGVDLQWIDNYPEQVQRYTNEDLAAVLKKYLRSERFVRVIGVPAGLSIVRDESPRESAATIN